ncbi:hypothetical protein PLICRDRAFT_54426 [Plicaturopsis crispa FD-325 SS-3]|nr:hypothetical protein PLICRDRAFT_54426 [Plicaturopsis crispa FD-325 SS-3]
MGLILSLTSEMFPGKPRYAEADTPDLTGKVTIVTGGNSGVGKVTARALLAHNAKVYIAGRDQSKVQAAIEELKAATGKDSVFFLKLDLADLNSVKAAAEAFCEKESQLHFLFNNAGVMETRMDRFTAQGYDLHFGVHVLGHYYFTELLLPILSATAKASPPGAVRIVNTTSIIFWTAKINFATFKDGPARSKVHPVFLYGQSKLGVAVYSIEFARRYADKGIVTSVINPGNLTTGIQRNLTGLQAKGVALLGYNVDTYGAISPLFAGVSPEGAKLHGKYIFAWARVGDGRALIRDPQLGRDLWTWLEEQVAQAGL